MLQPERLTWTQPSAAEHQEDGPKGQGLFFPVVGFQDRRCVENSPKLVGERRCPPAVAGVDALRLDSFQPPGVAGAQCSDGKAARQRFADDRVADEAVGTKNDEPRGFSNGHQLRTTVGSPCVSRLTGVDRNHST